MVHVCISCLICSGCPEAVKLLVGNKCDLPAEVDLQQAKVCYINTIQRVTLASINKLEKFKFGDLNAKCHRNVC